MGDALGALPDGVYEGEDFLDGDGLADSPEYSVRVRITKVDDHAEIDLRGSSGPSRTSINCTWADVKTGVSMALKLLLDPHVSVTDGTLRNVDVVVPERSILNAMPPTACQYYWEVVMTIQHAIYNALNPALGPAAVTAGTAPIVAQSYGHLPDGNEWNHAGYLLTNCGPWGATRDGDGDSGQQPAFSNLLVVGGVELFEVQGDVVLLASEYVPDTAGPGYYRGGAGSANDAMWRLPAEHRLSLFHARRPMAGGGVFGGESGPTSAGWLFTADTVAQLDPPFIPMSLSSSIYAESVPLGGVLDPVTHEIDPDGEYVFQPGRIPSDADTVVRTFFGGGGGWGDPFEREPGKVCRDVRDGYVTFAGASRDYGVVVRGDLRHPERITVDADATAALRAERGQARGD
jgi:N-methylhydantoinase B